VHDALPAFHARRPVTDSDSSTLHAVLRAFKAAAITHVVGLPDNASAPLFRALQTSKSIRLITVSREGEAFALASGLWVGGAAPLVVIQNTGLLESGDAVRGTALRMGVPLPCIITGRGYAKNTAAGISPAEPLTRELLTRPDVDTAAIFTEPTLRAWGIPFSRCRPGDDPSVAVAETIGRARTDERPVALVLTAALA
jgi:sulfopyruvate decarboxylase subunit alpha